MKYTHDESYNAAAAWRPLGIVFGVITGILASLSLFASANCPHIISNGVENVSGAGFGFGLLGTMSAMASVVLFASAIRCQYMITKYKLNNPHEFDDKEEVPRPSNWR